jgi:hypothetical protein
MAGPGTRPSARGDGSSNDGQNPTRQEAAEYIASLLEALRLVAHGAQMPFLAYLIGVAHEEAKSEKRSRG